jgi:hypothetical protein
MWEKVELENRIVLRFLSLLKISREVGCRICGVWGASSYLPQTGQFRGFLGKESELESWEQKVETGSGGERRTLGVLGEKADGEELMREEPGEIGIPQIRGWRAILPPLLVLRLGSAWKRSGESGTFRGQFPERVSPEASVLAFWGEDFKKISKVKAPELPEGWGLEGDWRTILMGRWTHREHNNILEARVALMTVRRAARDSKSWGTRILILTDSEATRGAYGKGRSCSRPLLSLCRRLSALALGLRMKVRFRYISTSRNCSDNPSRGVWRPGVFKKGR